MAEYVQVDSASVRCKLSNLQPIDRFKYLLVGGKSTELLSFISLKVLAFTFNTILIEDFFFSFFPVMYTLSIDCLSLWVVT